MYGGTITGVSAYTTPPNFVGDTSTSITIFFTANSSDSVLAWGGHIAERDDWGLDNSAAFISGSPYHMRILSWRDVTHNQDLNAGNTDRSLSAAAVIYPASITIIKDATPNGSTTFPFTASPSPLYNFNLVDDGTSANTKVFSDIHDFSTYTVAESTVEGWSLTGIVCSVVNANGGTQTVTLPSVSIALREAEAVTCTFSNSFVPAPSISLLKQIATSSTGDWFSSITVQGGSAVYYKFTVTNTGNVPLSPVTVTDPLVSTAGCTFTDPLPLGESTICVVGPVTAANAAGTYPNTATAHGGYNSTTYDSAPSTAEYIITSAPHLTITKTAAETTYDSVGDLLNYTIIATNDGNTTLAAVTVTDPLVSGLE
jgi:uncharacterized repeat protein (TIGR01451 family)